MNTVLLDVDGVLLDWTSGFFEWMGCVEGFEVLYDEPTSFNLLPCFPSLKSNAELNGHMDRFIESSYFGELEPIEGAIEGVQKLRKLLPEALFVAVTSCGHPTLAHGPRWANLRAFQLDQLMCLPLHACKRRVYSAFRPGLVIDDNLVNITAALDCGHQALVFDASYNQFEPGFNRLLGWEDIHDALTILRENA